MAELFYNKFVRLILDLPSRAFSSDSLSIGDSVGNLYSAGGLSAALFLLPSILITFLCIRINV